jgi:pre-rRNA-processing protein TSR3
VDCSWNRLRSRGGYPTEIPWLERLPERRRLPWLLAGNPQHFGRLGELNTAEAFAAALFVLGEPDRARSMLGRFAGGPGFFDVNRDALDRYAACRTLSEVREAELAVFSPGL